MINREYGYFEVIIIIAEVLVPRRYISRNKKGKEAGKRRDGGKTRN